MQTTLRARTTTSSQHGLAPELQAFWIPMLIRPAPPASPPSSVFVHRLASIPTHGAPCIVPANAANDPADADAGDVETNDANDLPAEREAAGAMDASTKPAPELEAMLPPDLDAKLAAGLEADRAFEREIERELERWADRSAERKALVPARRTADADDATDAQAKPADASAARGGPSPPREHGEKGAALLTALALAAMAIAILTMSGPAGSPVSAVRSEPGLSARPSAGASDLVTDPPRAGVRPMIAPPAERITPAAPAPALDVRDPAPVESTVVAPAACVAETAPTTFPTPLSGTSSDMDPALKDRPVEDPSILPPGGDVDSPGGAIAIDAEPAAPEVSTSAPLQGSRPPRRRTQYRGTRDTDDTLIGAQVIPTSRDLLDSPPDVPASSP